MKDISFFLLSTQFFSSFEYINKFFQLLSFLIKPQLISSLLFLECIHSFRPPYAKLFLYAYFLCLRFLLLGHLFPFLKVQFDPLFLQINYKTL